MEIRLTKDRDINKMVKYTNYHLKLCNIIITEWQVLNFEGGVSIRSVSVPQGIRKQHH